MNVSSKSTSEPRSVRVPENQNPKQPGARPARVALGQPEYVATIDVILEPLPQNGHCDRNSPCDWKGGAHHGR